MHDLLKIQEKNRNVRDVTTGGRREIQIAKRPYLPSLALKMETDHNVRSMWVSSRRQEVLSTDRKELEVQAYNHKELNRPKS